MRDDPGLFQETSRAEGVDVSTRDSTMDVRPRARVLVVTAGARACAIPVQHVAETMRPLPIESLAGTPGFVRGLSVIRGAPLPVLDLKALLEGNDAAPTYGRFVTVKIGERRFALGVDAVVGLRNLSSSRLEDLPPLLQHAGRDSIEALCADDAQLLVLLHTLRLVPDEVWAALASTEAAR